MSIRKLMSGTALCAVLSGSLVAGSLVSPVAHAADLDPALEIPTEDVSVMPVSNVVFGSGWYVRGDLGGAQLYKANPFTTGLLGYRSVFSSNAPSVTLSRSHDLGYVADLGGGYQFNQWFRADVVFDTHQPVHSSASGNAFRCVNGFTETGFPDYGGTCNGVFQAHLQSYAGLVNGYLDLGTWWRVTPYVGAGVGLAVGHYDSQSNYYQADGSPYNISITNPVNATTYNINFDRTASGTYYNLAYAGMAGFAVQVYDHTKIDIGYRYLSQGRVLGTNLTTNEVRAGIRYSIDN